MAPNIHDGPPKSPRAGVELRLPARTPHESGSTPHANVTHDPRPHVELVHSPADLPPRVSETTEAGVEGDH